MNADQGWQVFLVLETVDHHCDISDVSVTVNIFPHSPPASIFGIQQAVVKAELGT